METRPRTFRLERFEDVSGISGTGVVAWGTQFPDGVVVTHWAQSDVKTVTVWACIEDVLTIHGHAGATLLLWDTPDVSGMSNDAIPRVRPDGGYVL